MDSGLGASLADGGAPAHPLAGVGLPPAVCWVDFPSEGDQLTGTFVHEIAHGLLGCAIGDYIEATAYWSDRYTKLPKASRKEAPVTNYGKENAAEDLCESAMMFLVKPERLKANCPCNQSGYEARVHAEPGPFLR